MSDEQLVVLAWADVRDKTSEGDAQWLRSAEMLPHFHGQLVDMKKDLEQRSGELRQLISACTDEETLAPLHKNRADINRVLQSVEQRLAEVKRLRKASGDDLVEVAKRIARALERIADASEGIFEGGIGR